MEPERPESVMMGSLGATVATGTVKTNLAELYEHDFVQWTEETVRLLRARDLEDLDIDHLAEEIEDMGKSERRELASRLLVLVSHLLKWQFQPEKRSPSWRQTIHLQRRDIKDRLEQSPSLKPRMETLIIKIYPDARTIAALETGMLEVDLPSACPFTVEQILDAAFLPE